MELRGTLLSVLLISIKSLYPEIKAIHNGYKLIKAQSKSLLQQLQTNAWLEMRISQNDINDATYCNTIIVKEDKYVLYIHTLVLYETRATFVIPQRHNVPPSSDSVKRDPYVGKYTYQVFIIRCLWKGYMLYGAIPLKNGESYIS